MSYVFEMVCEMTVTIKVMEIDKLNKTVTIEAYDDKNGNRVMRSPFKYKQQSKKSIESTLRKELKAFQAPVWGGMCVHFYCNID